MKKSKVLVGLLAALMLLTGCEHEQSDTVDGATRRPIRERRTGRMILKMCWTMPWQTGKSSR